MRVLIVEDGYEEGRFLEKALQEMAYTVVWARSCAEARDAFYESGFDCIVLDRGLPDGEGTDLLREWREGGFREPVIILSALDEVRDKVHGLNTGADDYLAKPYELDELLARLRSIFRRQGTAGSTRLRYGDITMDLVAREVSVKREPLELTPREFALLELFLTHAGRVLSRSQIGEKVWKEHTEISTNIINVYVAQLRQKIEAITREPFLQTVRGVGYKLPKLSQDDGKIKEN